MIEMPTEQISSSFVDHLTTLKDHYEAILAESASKVDHAREQLSHIHALLDDQLVSATVSRKSSPSSRGKTVPSAQSSQQGLAAAPSSKATMKLSLLSPYAGLSKIEATAAVFKEHPGQVLHIDDLIEQLFGDLDSDELRAERVRMKDVMVRGVKRDLWQKVPKVPLSYILQEAPTPTASPKTTTKSARKTTRKRQGKPSKLAKPSKQIIQLEVLPPYRDQGMTIAVEGILRDHQGQAMTAEDVAYILYGELTPKNLAVAKKRLHDIFSKGVKQNRWQRLADRKGAYLIA